MIYEIIENLYFYYDIDRIIKVTKASGLSTENYFLYTESSAFFLKIYLASDVSKINQLNKVSKFFLNNNIPTPVPIRTKLNLNYFKINKKIVVLYSKIKGKVLHQEDFTKKALSSSAEILAKIHNISLKSSILDLNQSIYDTNRFNIFSKHFIKLIKDEPLTNEIDNLTLYFIELKRLLFNNIIKNYKVDNTMYMPKTIHGDFHNENILFDNFHNVISVLDLEQSAIGGLADDLFSFINLACCNEGFNNKTLEKCNYFIKEYTRKAEIENKLLIPGILRSLIDLLNSFYFERKIYISKDIRLISFLKRDIKKLIYLKDNLDNFLDKLLI